MTGLDNLIVCIVVVSLIMIILTIGYIVTEKLLGHERFDKLVNWFADYK